MFICIAGKNSIAIDVTEYLLSLEKKFDIGVVFNKTETGKNNWQRSFKLYAKEKGLVEYALEEMYCIPNLVFISLEFDQIINPNNFIDARLYNIHFSLLPAYKGMYTSAIPILNNERTVGVSFHRIDEGIDTGDIIDQTEFALADMTCRELYHMYLKCGTELVIKNIDSVLNGSEKAIPQKIEGSTYYSKNYIDYKNIVIDIRQTAFGIHNQLRAFNFREYQLPSVFGYEIISDEITNKRSSEKPGALIEENDSFIKISTIDYDMILYKDRLDELIWSCEMGVIERVKEICKVQTHINEQNNKGWSPLMVATYNNQKDIVYYLVSIGADIKAVNYNGTNMLMYAKDAYKKYGDNTLYLFYKKLGLSERTKDFYGHDLFFYMEKEGITVEELIVIDS